jgi:succinyl-CoA synthetase beta subunit
MIGSAAGGMDIEEVAAHTPEKITTVNIHPGGGLAALPMSAPWLFALGFEAASNRRASTKSRWRSTKLYARQRRELGRE